MKKLLAVLFLFLFVLPFSASAFTLTEDFDNYPLGFVATSTPTLSGIYGDFVLSFLRDDKLIFSEITNTGCFSGRCFKGNSLNAFTINNLATTTQIQSDKGGDLFLSYWFYIPTPTITAYGIGENVSFWSHVITGRNNYTNTDLLYSEFCNTNDIGFSVKVSDNPAGINNCDSDIYGQRVGYALFDKWTQVVYKLSTTTGQLFYRLNDSEWSAGIELDDHDYFEKYDFYFTDVVEPIGYDVNKIYSMYDTFQITDDESTIEQYVLPFDLFYEIWAVSTSTETLHFTDCTTDTTDDCGLIPNMQAIVIQSESSADVSEFELELTLTDFAGGTLSSPLETYSKTIANDTDLYSMYRTDTFIFPSSATTTYRLNVCVQYILDDFDSDLFVHTGDYRLCKDMLIGNGMASSTHGILADTSSDDVWVEYECNDIGILDVKKGVMCAFIWAFYPDTTSLNKFSSIKNNILTVKPIGYGTFIISDFITAVNSTSTTAMDREINFGRWFGLSGKATTTIAFAPLVSSGLLENALFDWIDFMLWFMFTIWVLWYALTRKL